MFDALQDVASARTIAAICALLSLGAFDVLRTIRHRETHLLAAAVIGTVLSIGLLKAGAQLFAESGNPFATALMLVFIAAGWRALFGPWGAETKAVLLGTFIFWLSLDLFLGIDARERAVRLTAAAAALVPAAVWCLLFLRYHRERLTAVLLLFFAGILSTVPILFYDALARSGAELHFFLFRVHPESFAQVAGAFVREHIGGLSALEEIVWGSVLTFLFVAIIEETSKFWVLSRSARRLCTSIDDVLQLSIIVAIGFAFAENVVNPVYFRAFVQEFLFADAGPDVGGFLGNVLGRSVLTSMVHIVSTGVLGYFYGLSLFAGPYLRERMEAGHAYRLLHAVHRMLRLPAVSLFRVEMILIGFLGSVLLHGAFNILVTLPELLPARPSTMGDMLPALLPVPFVSGLPVLLIPALFYVVGGFWLLTGLFVKQENMRERGHVVLVEEFVA